MGTFHITRRVPRAAGRSYPVARCMCGQEVHCEEPRDNECMRCGSTFNGDGFRIQQSRLSRHDVEELNF